jgi:hypothetical protein
MPKMLTIPEGAQGEEVSIFEQFEYNQINQNLV